MKETGIYFPIPASRIATFDVFTVARSKHHVAALVEWDVTLARQKIREVKRSGQRVSFNAWMLKVISDVLQSHPQVAAFKVSRKKIIGFPNINISMMVEKNINGHKVPIPLVIRQANAKSASVIYDEIEAAKQASLSGSDIVINQKPRFYERLYYHLPGFLRRLAWRIMLAKPGFVYDMMGNVSVTSLGMMGNNNGWFIHAAVHPVSFGLGSIVRKPLVVNGSVEIREVLNATILLDHDVIDGAPMVRFVKDLTTRIERGDAL